VHIIGCEVGLQRPDVVVEPLLDRYILGRAAEEHHWRVGMGVDQTRQGGHSGAVDNLASLLGRDLAGRLHCDNLLAAHKDVMSGQDANTFALWVDDCDILNQHIVHWRSSSAIADCSYTPRLPNCRTDAYL